jgi:serine/threonine protein kinase
MSVVGNTFKVSRRIAVGDLAEVMLAAQHGLGGLEKLVVIKRVLTHLRADPHFVRIFVEEAHAASALKHQHIAEVYDVVRDEHDLCVITEYVSGEDLAFLTRAYGKGELKLPVPIACRIIAQIADGLHHAHTRTGIDGRPEGMLHRDISPGNVIVAYNGVSKLTDFGVARADVQNIYARPATVKMKLAYRSPERIQHKETDERSDVYSLGVLLYEMLVGRRLFRGENEAGVLKNVMELKVPPPSKLKSEIAPQLDELVLRTIERDPANRTQSAQELRQGLESILARNKHFVSEHEVHVWITSSLKQRYTERQRMERSVVAESRNAPRPVAGTAELPPMFGGFSGSEVTVTPSATSVSTMVGRAGTSQMPLYRPETQRRSRTLLLSLIASLVTLVIVMTFAFAYWLGTRAPNEQGAVVPSEPSRRAGEPSLPSALLVHASPEGALLEIDGNTMAADVGAEGVLVPVSPKKTVTVTLRKAGFRTESLEVEAPERGTKRIFISLSTADGGAEDDTEGSGVDAGRSSGEKDETASTRGAYRRPRPDRSGTAGAPTEAKRGQGKGQAAASTQGRRDVATKRADSRASGRSTLEVQFSPPNAVLRVDGERVPGRSPVELSDLEPGQHVLTVSAPGFETQTRTVSLSPGEPGRAITIRLPSPIQTEPVKVTSIPAGATVRVDEKVSGKTPVQLRLPVGRTYRLELSFPGYRLWRTKLQVEADTVSRVEARLVRL